jgi:hypothetical protein
MSLTVFGAHRMKGYQGIAWPRLRVYRQQFYRGGRHVTPERWVASWDTAQFHTSALTFELGWWRFSIGVERPA